MSVEKSAEPSFEKLLEKLEGIVKKLETNELSLEDSLKIYEEGVTVVRMAQGRLDGMEGRIEQLMKDGSKKSIEVKTQA